MVDFSSRSLLFTQPNLNSFNRCAMEPQPKFSTSPVGTEVHVTTKYFRDKLINVAATVDQRKALGQKNV